MRDGITYSCAQLTFLFAVLARAATIHQLPNIEAESIAADHRTEPTALASANATKNVRRPTALQMSCNSRSS
jgi:hypothetical protein